MIVQCHGSISGRELSFVSDVAHACAVGYHTARFVAGMRADAFRQWGSARSSFKRTVGHSRSTRATRGFSPARGEPRPVHITWIATCRVYNSVVVIRRITPGLWSPRLRRPYRRLNQHSSVSRDLGRCLSRASAGPEAQRRALTGRLPRSGRLLSQVLTSGPRS